MFERERTVQPSREVKAGNRTTKILSGTKPVTQVKSKTPQEKPERKGDAQESKLGSSNTKEITQESWKTLKGRRGMQYKILRRIKYSVCVRINNYCSHKGQHHRERHLDATRHSQHEAATGDADCSPKPLRKTLPETKRSCLCETSPLGLCGPSATKFKNMDLIGAAAENGGIGEI